MTARGVKHSRWCCDYGCGGRHTRTHSVVCPCPCAPLFVHAGTHCCSSVPFPTVVDPCPCIPFCARLCWSPFVPTCLSPLGCTGWPSYLLLLVCALHRLFVLISIHLLVPGRPRPFVSTRLCWFPLSCACLRYLVALVWLSLVLVGVRLGLFVLVWLLFALVWASLCSFML
jgi:hypothetical protein